MHGSRPPWTVFLNVHLELGLDSGEISKYAYRRQHQTLGCSEWNPFLCPDFWRHLHLLPFCTVIVLCTLAAAIICKHLTIHRALFPVFPENISEVWVPTKQFPSFNKHLHGPSRSLNWVSTSPHEVFFFTHKRPYFLITLRNSPSSRLHKCLNIFKAKTNRSLFKSYIISLRNHHPF